MAELERMSGSQSLAILVVVFACVGIAVARKAAPFVLVALAFVVWIIWGHPVSVH